MLNDTIEELGKGKVVSLDSGEVIFKMDSYAKNPVVKPQQLGFAWSENGQLKIGAVFNGGAELLDDKIMLLPRCHRNYRKKKFFDEKLGFERTYLENYVSEVWPLVSEDGVHFTRLADKIIRGDGTEHQDFTYGIEDIRIIKQSVKTGLPDGNERYLLVGCGKVKPPFKGGNADRIAIYSTEDFINITYRGMVASFDSRNAIPFPEEIEGKFYMLFRFHPNIHLDVLEAGREQLLNPAKHLDCWERIYARRDKNLLLAIGSYPHEKEKIGPGTQVIKTAKGWLLIYHAVGELDENIARAYGLEEKIERGYSVGAALLDLNDPRKIICRTRRPIYIPSFPYELHGNDEYPVDVPAVVFPVGALVRKEKLLIYAGAGDKYIILLSCNLNKLLDYLWKYCQVANV